MLNTAIVGLGWWGRIIVEIIQGKSQRMRIVRGVEPDIGSARQFARKHSVSLTADLETVLTDQEVQAVILATPHSLHEGQVLAAARAGKHVFCEKPLGLSRASAERSVAACREAGVVLGIGHERRFEPPFREIRRLVVEGELGTLLQIEANFSHDKFLDLPKENWRRSKGEAPAGGMTATGIHLLDLAISFLGPAESVLAESRTLASDLSAGDSLATLLRFHNGTTASINVMLATPFISRFAVYGSKGWAEVRDKAHVEAPEGWTLTRGIKDSRSTQVTDYPVATPVRDNLEAFAEACTGDASYPISTDEMVATVAALEAVFKSSESRQLQPVQ
jgi:predicted dehydrogenase